jgi:hypothetical protein
MKNFVNQSIGVAAKEVNADIWRRLHTVVFPVTNNTVAFGFYHINKNFQVAVLYYFYFFILN